MTGWDGLDRAAFVAAARDRFGALFRERDVAADGGHLRCAVGGAGAPLVLLHGWPQTWREWRHVMPPLAERRTVYAFDLPGLGRSSPPLGGYDTASVAGELRSAFDRLGIGRFDLVAHDVGGMVAFAFALAHPERVRRFAVVEAPLPGIGDWDAVMSSPKLWHFGFNRSPGLPEALTAGREGDYLGFIYRRDTAIEAAISEEDAAEYAASYAAPGRMEAGLAYYRALDRSAERNRAAVSRGARLTMPVLAAGGDAGNGPAQAERLRAVADRVEALVVEGCGHFVAEERPEVLGSALARFIEEEMPA